MNLSDFDYALPGELIAQQPCEPRDAARLLVHELGNGRTVPARTEHRHVRDLTRELRDGDLLVVNDTRVVPARLFGRRASGGRVEFLFVEPHGDAPRTWRALVNPARKLKPGEVVPVDGGACVRALERPLDAAGRPSMEWLVELEDPADPTAPASRILEQAGHMPLPPYIRRTPGDAHEAVDRERYQTVYAERPGAVAAPTAGLHFTPELLELLRAGGVRTATVTLHVGPGTFQPVKCERIEEHVMHSERIELTQVAVDAVLETKRRGGRVVAVGTTSVRVLEGAAAATGELRPLSGSTELFLRPGSTFHVVDALLTNFHLPRSSLLMLVAAFAGLERTHALYREAIEREYRFFSYGDAMLLLR